MIIVINKSNDKFPYSRYIEFSSYLHFSLFFVFNVTCLIYVLLYLFFLKCFFLFFFISFCSFNIIVVIGYGNVFPRTYWGKITTILYAIIGMPLFLLYLSNIGDIMARSFKWLYATCCLCRGCPGVSKRRAERRKRKHAQIYLEYDERRGSWQVKF